MRAIDTVSIRSQGKEMLSRIRYGVVQVAPMALWN